MTSQQCNAVVTCDKTSYCGLVNLTGTVNTTEIKSESAGDQILYAWRITIENCSDAPLCNAQVRLDLDWKTQTAQLNGPTGPIYQFPILGFPPSASVVNILVAPNPLTNPTNTFTPNLTWNGNTVTNLSTVPFDLPVGKVIIEVFVESPKDALDQGEECYLPALFPAIVDINFRSQRGTVCPMTVSTFIGCSPKCITVDPENLP